MLLPTSHTTAFLLLVVSVLCLGSWANLLFVGETRRRFELFYFDFAIGAILLALLAAVTLGAFGSELSFSDRITVAGLRSQAFEIAAGFIFNVGNMLLAAAVPLIGLACSFPVAAGVGLLIVSSLSLSGISMGMLAIGDLLVLAAVAAAIAAARLNQPPATTPVRQSTKSKSVSRVAKGLVVALLAGILIGGSAPLAQGGLWGDIGLGAYGGMLLFCCGLLVSTLIFNPFFMAIGIEGGRLSLRSYLSRTLNQHLIGIAGGMMWAAGTLAALLAQSVPAAEQPSQAALTFAAGASVLVAMLWGTLLWKEFVKAPVTARRYLAATAVLFTAGLAVLSLRFLS